MADKQRNPVFITPKGIAVFLWLRKPDTKYKPEGEYRIKLRVSKDEAQPMLDKLQAQLDEYVVSAKAAFATNPKNKGKKFNPTVKAVYTECVDDAGNDTGEVELNFKRLASGVSKKTQEPWTARVDLFDAYNNPLPPNVDVWGGSLVRVSFESGVYDKPATGIGLSFRLKAVKVIKLVEGGQRTAASCGFGDDSDDDDADLPKAGEDAAAVPEGDEDIDF